MTLIRFSPCFDKQSSPGLARFRDFEPTIACMQRIGVYIESLRAIELQQ